MPTSSKRILISADHGLAIIYFLQSDVVPTLLNAGIEVILLTDDAILEQIAARFAQPGLSLVGLRLAQANAYQENSAREIQWWLGYLRRVGSSNRINTEAMDSYIRQVEVEQPFPRRLFLPPARVIIGLLRRSRRARKALVNWQMRYNPRL
jgi:hypothetical protein